MENDAEATIAVMRRAAEALRSPTSTKAEEFRALQSVVNAVQSRQADLLAEVDASRAYESDGASSVATWARQLTGVDAKSTRQLVRASRTMRDLPALGGLAHAGALTIDHVHGFTYALKHIDHAAVVASESDLLDVALGGDPMEFFGFLRQAKAQVHEDQLDKAWLDGMDKHDLRCTRVADGYQVIGHLGPDTGAKLRAFLNSSSVPRDARDDRAPSNRRVAAFDELLSAVLANGLPADGGVRPHISVVVEAEWLQAHCSDAARSRALDLKLKPAVLDGFGPIGPQLLDHLLCGADLTPILVDSVNRHGEVLDVGHTKRYATVKQTRAVVFRQGGICETAGCRHPIAHIHHIRWWSEGGRTDLDNLTGRCAKCHTLIHQGRLEAGAKLARAG